MNYRDRKLVHVLHYLMSHCAEASCDKVHLLKLAWLADRYHLRKFGSFMTSPNYRAYQNGPVNQSVYGLLKKIDDATGGEYAEFFSSYPERGADGELHAYYRVAGPIDYVCLSDTNVEALNVAIRKMADLETIGENISDYSHRFREWQSVCDGIDPERGVFPQIRIADFFEATENPRDEYCADVPDELVKLNRDLNVGD